MLLSGIVNSKASGIMVEWSSVASCIVNSKASGIMVV